MDEHHHPLVARLLDARGRGHVVAALVVAANLAEALDRFALVVRQRRTQIRLGSAVVAAALVLAGVAVPVAPPHAVTGSQNAAAMAARPTRAIGNLPR